MPDEDFWRRSVTIYLYHLDSPYKHARHYLGSAENYDVRAAEHLAGQGARLLAAAKAAGIGWVLARRWDDVPRFHERDLHKRKENKVLCPICSGKQAYGNGNYSNDKRNGVPRTEAADSLDF